MKKLFLMVMAVWAGLAGTAAAQNSLSPAEATVYEGDKLADEGAWCWFADPRALHYENASGTINSSYVGYIDVHGAVKAVQYDFLKGRRSEVLIRSYFQPDDHNNPTFLVLPDERVMIFYSRHTDEPCFYYRRRPPEPPFSLELPLLSERQNGRQMLNTPEVFQRIHQGGMPALVTGTYSNASIFYSSYIDTYMERDVRRLSNDIDSLKFLRFLRSVAARTSQQVNYKGIADDAEIDQTTAKNWLHVLEALGIIFLLEPYSNNVLKRTVSTPKLYFYDSGIVCYLTRWSSPETAMEGAMSGALLENYTVAEIIKTYQNAGQEPFLYYYRDKDAREIDLILERDGKLFPIEIKKMASPPKKLTKVFDLIDKSPLQRGTGAILCMADQLGAFDQNNLIVPISLI